jgi:hypothetical protein
MVAWSALRRTRPTASAVGREQQMPIRFPEHWERPTVDFLTQSFLFVRDQWPHAVREQTPDQGFEQRLREHFTDRLQGWSISAHREMQLAAGLYSASGTLHEIDIIAARSGIRAIAEVKNYQDTPGKNDVIVFHAKILDYFIANADLLQDEICLLFIASTNFDDAPLAACLGLGIHPVTPNLRPLPLLIRNAQRIEADIRTGRSLPDNLMQRYEDHCATVNRMAVALNETWPSSRYGYQGPNRIVVRTGVAPEPYALVGDFRALGAESAELITLCRQAWGM